MNVSSVPNNVVFNHVFNLIIGPIPIKTKIENMPPEEMEFILIKYRLSLYSPTMEFPECVVVMRMAHQADLLNQKYTL